MKPMSSQYFTVDNCPLQVGSVIHDFNRNRDVMVIAREWDVNDIYFICITDGSDVSWITGKYLAENYTYYPNWPDTDEKPCYHEPNRVEPDVAFINGVFELAKQLPGSEKLYDGPVWNDNVHTAIQEGAVDMLNTIKEVLNENN